MIALLLIAMAQTELTQLTAATSEADASAILDRSGAKVTRLSASQPQALRRALIESRLLETWNRFQLTPKTKDGELDPAAFERLILAEQGQRRWVLTFGAKGLIAALARYPVPVDPGADPPGGFSAARLDPLKRALSALTSFGLSPLESDTYGNRFAWKGKSRGATVRALYRPEDDELVVLWAAGS